MPPSPSTRLTPVGSNLMKSNMSITLKALSRVGASLPVLGAQILVGGASKGA